MNPLILVVEDEKPIRHFIRVALETQKYGCLESETGGTALLLAASHRPDIIILDLGLPDMDGLDVIKKLREWTAIPVIVVSARGHDREKVEALDTGADDYLTKPFSIAELLARIRVSLRKKSVDPMRDGTETSFCIGEMLIDFDKRRVTLAQKDVHLTPTEYHLLTLLAAHRGKVLTHRFLIQEIWGGASPDDTQSLRVCMGNLRRKIESDPAQPRYIITEVGVGYRMVDE